MNNPRTNIAVTCALFAIIAIGFVFYVAENDDKSSKDFSNVVREPQPPNQIEKLDSNRQLSSGNTGLQDNVLPPEEGQDIEIASPTDPRIASINSGFSNYEFSTEETDTVMESLVRRYGEFIYALNLQTEEESSLISIVLNILKREHYLSQLVRDGEISHEEFRRISTTNEDMELALSSFLTQDEMQKYLDFMEQSEIRFLERFKNIQIMQLTTGAPKLSEANRKLVADIFIEELARLRSGEGGVLSNDHVHTSYLRTKARISQESTLNSEQLQVANQYLDWQIGNFE